MKVYKSIKAYEIDYKIKFVFTADFLKIILNKGKRKLRRNCVLSETTKFGLK